MAQASAVAADGCLWRSGILGAASAAEIGRSGIAASLMTSVRSAASAADEDVLEAVPSSVPSASLLPRGRYGAVERMGVIKGRRGRRAGGRFAC